MRALLLKDYYLLRKAMGLYLLICVAFQLMRTGGMFISVLYAALLPVSAFAYDDRSRWGELAAVMPYSVWDIVLSRYALGWLGVAAMNLASAAGRLLFSTLMPWTDVVRVDLPGVLTLSALSVLILAVSLPVYFRFDAEKSRLVRTLLLVIICGGSGAMMSLTNVDTFIDGSLRSYTSFTGPAAVVWLAAVAATAVSVPLSAWAHRARYR